MPKGSTHRSHFLRFLAAPSLYVAPFPDLLRLGLEVLRFQVPAVGDPFGGATASNLEFPDLPIFTRTTPKGREDGAQRVFRWAF